MKTYNKLFEKFISDENIMLSLHTALRGDKSKRTKRRIYKMINNPDYWLPRIKRIASNFNNAVHHPRIIYDGVTRKQRTIIVPTCEELIVQHMIVNILKPIFLKNTYRHSYAALPNRGGHQGKKFVSRWLKNDRKNTKYCAQLDIHHFFESIDKNILKSMLNRKIKDKRFLKIIFTIIDVNDKGLPLGFYTSQWLANWYLAILDHYIKEDLHIKYYMRYMDDMILLSSNKRKLHNSIISIKQYLNTKLNLELKHNYSVFRVGVDKSNYIDFMGFRFYSNRTVLRRSIMLNATRKANTLSKKLKVQSLTVHDARQMLSYKGWLSDSNTYGVYLKYIKPCVKFKTLGKIISRYDRSVRRKCGTKAKVA